MLPLNFEPINYWGFSIYHLNIFETSTISDYLNIPNLFLLPHFYLVKKPSVIHIPSILLYTLHACVWIIWRFLLSCRGYCYFKELVWVERIIKDRWFSIYCFHFLPVCAFIVMRIRMYFDALDRMLDIHSLNKGLQQQEATSNIDNISCFFIF